MPQTASKDTGGEPVFFMLACVPRECVLHMVKALLDPNLTVMLMKACGDSLVLLKSKLHYRYVVGFIHMNMIIFIHKHNHFVLIFIDGNPVKSVIVKNKKQKNP